MFRISSLIQLGRQNLLFNRRNFHFRSRFQNMAAAEVNVFAAVPENPLDEKAVAFAAGDSNANFADGNTPLPKPKAGSGERSERVDDQEEEDEDEETEEEETEQQNDDFISHLLEVRGRRSAAPSIPTTGKISVFSCLIIRNTEV